MSIKRHVKSKEVFRSQELGKQLVSVNASFVKRWAALFDGSLVTVGCYSTFNRHEQPLSELTGFAQPCFNSINIIAIASLEGIFLDVKIYPLRTSSLMYSSLVT